MIDHVLIAKTAIAVFLVACGLVLALAPLRLLSFFRSTASILVAFLGIRLAMFLVVFIILHYEVQSDAPLYYSWALLTMEGHVPGESESLPLVYGPLFLYIIGFLTKVWNDPRVIILFMIIVEFFLFLTWLSLSGLARSQAVMRRAAILYAFCPLSVLTSALGGNNDVLAGLFVALFVSFAYRQKTLASGFTLGLSIVVTKALTLLAGLPILYTTPRKWLWIVGAILPVAIVYGAWVLLSVDLLAEFRFHGMHYSSGNLPFWLGLFGPELVVSDARPIVNLIGALLVIVVSLIPLIVRGETQRTDLIPGISATLTAFMILSAKTFPHYLLIALFPIMIIIAEQRLIVLAAVYALLCITTSVESSMWFRWFHNDPSSVIRGDAGLHLAQFLIFFTVDSLLLGSYAMILYLSIRSCFRFFWRR